jgi:hypothetical protein
MSKTRANLHLGDSHWFVADQKDYFSSRFRLKVALFLPILTKGSRFKIF